MADDTAERKVTVQKDTGWSWLVLAAVFVTQSIIFGLLLCFGIYFVTLLDYFRCSKRDVAAVGSMAYGIKCLTGLLSSILYRRFGCRAVVMSGGLIAASGCVLSYFATELHHLYLSYGCLVGFGLGLVFTPSLGVLPDYFDRYRYFATAFATVGSAVGTFIFQPLFYQLIDTYSWQGSMLINAGIALQIVLLGSLMRSRSVTTNLKFSSLIESSLFKDTKFWLLFFNCILWAGSVYIVFSMANSLVMNEGISKSESTLLVSLLGLGNVCGRLASSFAGQFVAADRPLLYALATTLFTAGTLAATFGRSMTAFAVSLAAFGVGFGAMLAQLPGVIMQLFGASKLVNGLGYTMFAAGVGGLLLPVVAGRVADGRGGVKAAFALAAVCSSVAVILALVNCYLKFRQRRTMLETALDDIPTSRLPVSPRTGADATDGSDSNQLLSSLKQ